MLRLQTRASEFTSWLFTAIARNIMQMFIVASLVAGACLTPQVARSDIRRPIGGSALVISAEFAAAKTSAAATKDLAEQNADPDMAADQKMFWAHPLFDRRPSLGERSAPLSADLADAILRIEGIYDPTRIGLFGVSLRMKVRAGTASMANVFGDSWTRADSDPNTHRRVRYLAYAWNMKGPRDCDSFKKFRPDDAAVVLDTLSDLDCRRILQLRNDASEPLLHALIVAAPLSMPVFAAPYPGGRVSTSQLWAAQEAKVQAIRNRLRLKWRGDAAAALVDP